MLQRTTLTTSAWPSAGETDDLRKIVWAQMETVSDQAALIEEYQDILDAAQDPAAPPPPPAQAQGTANEDVWTFASVAGIITLGSLVEPATPVPSFPAGMVLTQQLTGTTGGAGTYRVNTGVTVPITTAIAVTLVPQTTDPPWPLVTTPDDLMKVVAAQTLLLRTQTALIQQYQDLLNVSATPVPTP